MDGAVRVHVALKVWIVPASGGSSPVSLMLSVSPSADTEIVPVVTAAPQMTGVPAFPEIA
jgi:hypothetical protein